MKWQRYDPEIGQAIFGSNWGEFGIPEKLERHVSEKLRELADALSDGEEDVPYYEDEVFALRPYYWSDDEEEEVKPNFYHKASGLEIRWYKHIGRGMSCNRKFTKEEFDRIAQECFDSARLAIEDAKKRYEARKAEWLAWVKEHDQQGHICHKCFFTFGEGTGEYEGKVACCVNDEHWEYVDWRKECEHFVQSVFHEKEIEEAKG